MKQNKITRLAALLLCAAALFGFSALPASANSAQTHWSGTDSTGAIITDGDCPIIVEHELLTFDLQEFPSNYYSTVEDYLAYTGRVTAEYTFYNPADYTVTAKLLFPFGCSPDYADLYDRDTGRYLYHTDTGKYDITVNGEAVEKTVRHSLSYYYDQFELEKDLALLHDGFAKDAFYSPDLTVTRYTYTISGADTDTYRAASAAFDLPRDLDGTVVWFYRQSGLHTQEDGDLRLSAWVGEEGQTVTLYAFGEPLSTLPEWKFYKDGGVKDGEEIPGTVTHTATDFFTFRDFALANWTEESGVSQTDWYNAVVAELNDDIRHFSPPIVTLDRYTSDFSGCLMRWYEYEITVGANQRIVNTVTAPIYPSINLRYEPDIYGYTYLLSPAQTWAQFGQLEIVVNTPYFITESTPEGFAKTEGGYTLTLEGLPEGELEFVLCTGEKPFLHIKYNNPLSTFLAVTIMVVLIAGITTAIVLLRRKKRRGGT